MSRVIKEANLKHCSVFNVNYEDLLGNGSKENGAPPSYLEADGFTPLFFNEHLGAVNDVEVHDAAAAEVSLEAGIAPAADIPEGMIYISEDELQGQLSDAYARGAEEGRQVAERGLAHVFKALRDGADTLAALRDKVLRESEVDLLKLSSLVAKKIVLQELKQDPQILANIVAATISCCSDQERISIRLSPDDYQMVMANRQMIPADEGRVVLVPDNAVKLGGCLVETTTGTVDARIESQLDEVYNRCMEERGIPQESLIVGVDEEQGL
ncbi:flagellar assembly protein FliH [Geobacter pelophilus]|uniref:Flagellar assembly protein FliH n=1 Tax=Geoanaerobacter pelophilus TaxID=60036 RepID=A0AAW4L5X7_9BACT|nr:FliH/SctL family protein [Geoanaerobacter pelophilus]MBT0663970.1 flagellar assembly protein FliH [Geoanaerobacter pelophilus]